MSSEPMRLVELSLISGVRIAINPRAVAFVIERESVIIGLITGLECEVDGSYRSIVDRLLGGLPS